MAQNIEKEKKSNMKNGVKALVFLLMALLLFGILSDTMMGTDVVASTNFTGFYAEPKDSLDVILIGASEIYTGFSPTKAWDKEHFTSFCLASPALPGVMYKVVLQEALRRQKPKAVVVEINGFLNINEGELHEAKCRNVLDNIRWSKVRYDYITENIPEEDRMSYYIPFISYHEGWNYPKSFLRSAFIKDCIRLRGQSFLKGVSTYTSVSYDEKSTRPVSYKLKDEGMEKLRDFLEYCREEKLENVLFLRAPHQRPTDTPKVFDSMWELIHSYGYDTLNCMENGIGADWEGYSGCIDPKQDYYNAEHLNYYGMEKFTEFLSGYLADQYDLHKPSHTDKVTKAWDSSSREADKLFEQCIEDMESNRYCHYYEYSIYVKPRNLHD